MALSLQALPSKQAPALVLAALRPYRLGAICCDGERWHSMACQALLLGWLSASVLQR